MMDRRDKLVRHARKIAYNFILIYLIREIKIRKLKNIVIEIGNPALLELNDYVK